MIEQDVKSFAQAVTPANENNDGGHSIIRNWSVEKQQVRFNKDDTHTLSLYTQGGYGSYRKDKYSKKGAPGLITLMPQYSESEWEIQNKIDFVHFYFSDDEIKYFAAANYDLDIRQIEMIDALYVRQDVVKQKMLHLLRLQNESIDLNALQAEELKNELFDLLIHHFNCDKVRHSPISGGLSLHHRRKINNAIAEQLHTKLTIDVLAEEIGLSAFHFARMFKTSFGISPAQYINCVRLEKIRQLLASNEPLAQISAITGFSQQSHMTSLFKKACGITPAQFRKSLNQVAKRDLTALK